PGDMPILYLSTLGNFAVPGVSGSGEDVFSFEPTSLGASTAGSYGPGLGLEGGLFGLAPFGLDGIAIVGAFSDPTQPPLGGGGGVLSAAIPLGAGFQAGGALAPVTGTSGGVGGATPALPAGQGSAPATPFT